jgi:hypothetical protein
MLTGVINLRWLRTLEAALQRCFAAATVVVTHYLSGHPKPANEGHLKTGQ